MNLYHPKAEHAATLHCFIEKTNADRSKCVISQDASSGNRVIVYPKALQPELQYSVIFRYGKEADSKTGKELMQSGITFSDTCATQLIFLNLNNFPGSGTDKIKPTPPSITSVKNATFCNHEGVAIEWNESKDNNIIAGYRIYRDKQLIDFTAIGTFYFDQSEVKSSKAHYKIVAIDGDGNTSEK